MTIYSDKNWAFFMQFKGFSSYILFFKWKREKIKHIFLHFSWLLPVLFWMKLEFSLNLQALTWMRKFQFLKNVGNSFQEKCKNLWNQEFLNFQISKIFVFSGRKRPKLTQYVCYIGLYSMTYQKMTTAIGHLLICHRPM